MHKLENAYNQYVDSLRPGEKQLSRQEFIEKLELEYEINKFYGSKITRMLSLGERIQIAYPDNQEGIETLVFMGTKSMKKLLNKIKAPKRKLLLQKEEIHNFLSKSRA